MVAVGIDIYEDPRIAPLVAAVRDATAVADLFRRGVRGEDVHIEVLLDRDATRTRVMETISEDLVRRAGENDVVLLYFACHGSPERDAPGGEDQGYLIAHDTSYDRIHTTGIDMEHSIPTWFRRIEARLVILCLDTCFSGRAGGRTFSGPRRARFRDQFASSSVSLKDLRLGHGRVIVAAARDDQVAREDASLGHGIFTYHLLRILKRSPRETGSPTIGAATLADEVSNAVSLDTGEQQIPVFHGKTVRAQLPYLGDAF